MIEGEDGSLARSHARADEGAPPSIASATTESATPAPCPPRAGGPDARIGETLDGRYTIIERIGAGGMAVVYRAREQGFITRDVAIKLLSPESALSQATIARFLKEAQAISDIGHPNVVHIHHVGRTCDGQLYLAMELLRGQTLAGALTELKAVGEVFSWERLAPIILQICAALQAAHKRNIVHRDIKPGNCFRVDVDGNPDFIKVLDFGIAKIQTAHGEDTGSEETPLTQQGVFIGTPHYAAPETIEPDPNSPIDGRADQFSVGVMMYQLLTGTLPFTGSTKLEALFKTVHQRPPSPRERAPERNIPPEVDALVMRAMSISPADRFPAIGALAEEVRRTIGGAGSSLSQGTGASGRGATPSLSVPLPPLPEDSATPVPPEAPVEPVPPEEVSERTGAIAYALSKDSERTGSSWLLAAVMLLLGTAAVIGFVVYELRQAERAPQVASAEQAATRTRAAERPAPVRSAVRAVAPQEQARAETYAQAPDGAAKAKGSPPAVAAPTAAELPPEDVPLPPLEEIHAAANDEAARERRRKKISTQVRALADSKGVLRCMLDEGLLVVGDKMNFPVEVTVGADGKVISAQMDDRATVPHRGPKRVEACLINEVKKQRFAGGEDAALEVAAVIAMQ